MLPEVIQKPCVLFLDRGPYKITIMAQMDFSVDEFLA
jgi:hypothetical protein